MKNLNKIICIVAPIRKPTCYNIDIVDIKKYFIYIKFNRIFITGVGEDQGIGMGKCMEAALKTCNNREI